MLARKIMRFSANSPRFRRLLWRRWYEYLAGYRIDGWRFMNYGYAELDPEAPAVSLDPDDEPERYPIQLYHRVAGAVDLAGLGLLEKFAALEGAELNEGFKSGTMMYLRYVLRR